MTLLLDDYDFELPKSLIAQAPAKRREDSRLLVFDRANGKITDDHFYNIDKYLVKNSTIVVNNSKVEQCRLIFGKKELFILKAFNDKSVLALVRPGRVFKLGNTVELSKGLSLVVREVKENGQRIVEFNQSLDSPAVTSHQHIPLPPYIAQNDALKDRYQTVYADPSGSKAAPTAGLHFSQELINSLKKSHKFTEVTLHVGLGTFAPIDQSNIDSKQLHSEYYEISDETAKIIESSAHITAVGTTSLRTLESAFDQNRKLIKSSGDTSIFIQPGYTFKVVDSLVTNFHLPKSSLLMLISAFMGFEEMKLVYKHAIENKYRFYSFGDAMLIV